MPPAGRAARLACSPSEDQQSDREGTEGQEHGGKRPHKLSIERFEPPRGQLPCDSPITASAKEDERKSKEAEAELRVTNGDAERAAPPA